MYRKPTGVDVPTASMTRVRSRKTPSAISQGGRYTLDNVVPACRSCNASKCNDEVTGWMRRKKLDEERFLVRQYEISRALRTGIETS